MVTAFIQVFWVREYCEVIGQGGMCSDRLQ